MTEQAVESRGPGRPGAGRRRGRAEQMRGFLGRGRELAALEADLMRAGLDTMAGRPAPRSRILLITGRPGTGRSTLAEEFAARQLAGGDYPDGLLRARLTDPGGAAVTNDRTARDLLGKLGVAAPPGADEDELTEALRAALAERRAVLLLDDVCTADQVNELAPDSRGCLVVAVARGPLTGVPDVRPCTLGALEQEASLRLLTRGAGETRVTVDPRAAEALAEDCAHLPAALVLAAGWLAAYPEAAIADARKRLAALPHAGPDGVSDILDRTFRLALSRLPAPAARILRLLALSPAGQADAHTAAALAGCTVGTARTTLADLALLGLLRITHDNPPGPEESVGPLYAVPGCLDPVLQARLRDEERPGDVLLAQARMLERTVRQLMACHAITEERGTEGREWLSGLPGTMRFASPEVASDWLTLRLGSLLAAARLVVAEGELDTLARRLIAALTAVLVAHRGAAAAAPDLYRLHELVLDVAERQGLTRERAAALLNLGDLDVRTGRPAVALERYRTALETLRAEEEHADQTAMGRALESIGGTHAELGGWQRAADWYDRALTLAQARRDLEAEARLHGRLAAALAEDEQWREALRSWRAAAAAHRRRGDASAQARALTEVARVYEQVDQHEEAMRACFDALYVAERSADHRLKAAVRMRLADGAERLGRLRDAERHRAAADRLLAAHAGPEPEEVVGLKTGESGPAREAPEPAGPSRPTPSAPAAPAAPAPGEPPEPNAPPSGPTTGVSGSSGPGLVDVRTAPPLPPYPPAAPEPRFDAQPSDPTSSRPEKGPRRVGAPLPVRPARPPRPADQTRPVDRSGDGGGSGAERPPHASA